MRLVPLFLFIFALQAHAVPLELSFSAQLTDNAGVPMTRLGTGVPAGAVGAVRFTFWSAPTGGLQRSVTLLDSEGGSPLAVAGTYPETCAAPFPVNCPSVTLNANGIFQASLFLSAADFHTLFPTSGASSWIQLERVYVASSGTVTPAPDPTPFRQKFTVAPYCLKVPVDGSTHTYNANGELIVGTGSIASAHVAAGAITGTKLATGAIGTTHLVDKSVTAAKLADGTIGGTQLAANAVGSTHLQSNAVTSAKIAALAVQGSHIASNALTGSHVQAGSITDSHIAASGITSSGKVSGSAIVSGTIGGSASMSTTGNVSAGSGAFGNLSVSGTSGSFSVPSTQAWSYFAGSVGIGNAASSPRAPLEIATSATTGTRMLVANTSSGGRTWRIESMGSSIPSRVGNLEILDYTANVGLVLTPTGNIGIGTFNPQTRLDLGTNGTLRVGDAYVSAGGSNAYFASNQYYNGAGYVSPNATPGAMIQVTQGVAFYRHNGAGAQTLLGSIDTNGLFVSGSVWASACVYASGSVAGSCPSDERLKEDIDPIRGSLDRISRLNPVHFRWRKETIESQPELHLDRAAETGFIAQEVEEVFPELVHTGKDGFKRVTYGTELQVQTIQAVRELRLEKSAEIAELRQEKDAEIRALREKNRELESRLERIESGFRSR